MQSPPPLYAPARDPPRHINRGGGFFRTGTKVGSPRAGRLSRYRQTEESSVNRDGRASTPGRPYFHRRDTDHPAR
jgi:hypothetical protein